MSDSEQRGLAGELVFLEKAIQRFGPRIAVEGWVGPLDAARDFDLPEELSEVKTISPGSLTVQISSLEQLEGEPYLVVYELAHVQSQGTGTFSLPDAVTGVRKAIEGDDAAAEEFERRLRLAGYEPRKEYETIHFRLLDSYVFKVAQAFPRLVRSAVSKGVVEAKYSLYLPDLKQFRYGGTGE